MDLRSMAVSKAGLWQPGGEGIRKWRAWSKGICLLASLDRRLSHAKVRD